MTGRNSNPTIERKTVDFRLSLPISLKIPIHFSNSLFRAVEKGHVAITHMKAGVALLRARQRELKSFGRSLSRVSAWVPIANNILQPHRIGHFAQGQKIPNFFFPSFLQESDRIKLWGQNTFKHQI